MSSTSLPYQYQKVEENSTFDDEDLEDLIMYREINAKRDKRSILFAKIAFVGLLCFVVSMCAINGGTNRHHHEIKQNHETSTSGYYNMTCASNNNTEIPFNTTSDVEFNPTATNSYKLVATTGSLFNNKYGYYYSEEMHVLHFNDPSNKLI